MAAWFTPVVARPRHWPQNQEGSAHCIYSEVVSLSLVLLNRRTCAFQNFAAAPPPSPEQTGDQNAEKNGVSDRMSSSPDPNKKLSRRLKPLSPAPLREVLYVAILPQKLLKFPNRTRARSPNSSSFLAGMATIQSRHCFKEDGNGHNCCRNNPFFFLQTHTSLTD